MFGKIFFGLFMGIVGLAMVDKVSIGSMVEKYNFTKMKASIKREEAIKDAVVRYIIDKNTEPTMADLINNNYISSTTNDNGFGGSYSLAVDRSKGTITVSTEFADSKQRDLYSKMYTRSFKSTTSGNIVTTQYVIPSDALNADIADSFRTAVGDIAPDPTQYTFWIDTSSSPAIKKVSNGTAWKTYTVAATGGSTVVTTDNTVASSTDLPTSGVSDGDVKYVLNSGGDVPVIEEYVYVNGGWYLANSGAGGSSNKYIQLVNGARYWSDNSYATSCLKYIQPDVSGYSYSGETGDGVYKIDPDGAGGNAPFDVYCDQTTDGGGWIYILNRENDLVSFYHFKSNDFDSKRNVFLNKTFTYSKINNSYGATNLSTGSLGLNIGILNHFTVSFWVNDNLLTSDRTILSFVNGDTSIHKQIYFRSINDNDIAVLLYDYSINLDNSIYYNGASDNYIDSGNHGVLPSTNLSNRNEWYLCTLTYDGYFFKYYHNDKLVYQIALSGWSLYEGSLNKWSNNSNLYISKLRIYNKAISSTEVSQLYNAEK